MKIKSRKHWYAYTGNLFLIIFFGLPCTLSFFNTESSTTQGTKYLGFGMLIFGIWLLYYNIRAMILKYRVQWTFENDVLTRKSGFLPWHRKEFRNDISQIYEAFLTKSFMGNLLGFGGVKIKKTDGVSSIALQFSMTNHKKLVDTINSRISEYKINQKENTSVLTAKTTLSEELRELSNLNKDGVISNEQFEILKRKLIR